MKVSNDLNLIQQAFNKLSTFFTLLTILKPFKQVDNLLLRELHALRTFWVYFGLL